MANYKDKTTVIESELYQRVAQVCGYSKTTVRDVLLAAYELVLEELKQGTPVVVGKFGTFERKIQERAGGYNFMTKERYGACKNARIKYTPYAPFKKAVIESYKQG